MLEARGRHVDVVTASRKIGRPIDAGNIGLSRPGDHARIGVGDCDGSVLDGGLRER